MNMQPRREVAQSQPFRFADPPSVTEELRMMRDQVCRFVEAEVLPHADSWERDGKIPAFPFGFGLSYTRYRYAGLKLAGNQLGPSETLRVSLDVSNIGAHAGEEVVQLYISPVGSAVERAPKELKAFTRIALQPGETRTVQLSVPIPRLAYYDETRADFVVEPLEYDLFVGAHSLDRHALKAHFVVRSE